MSIQVPEYAGGIWRHFDRWQPKSLLGHSVREAMEYVPPWLRAELLERIQATLVIESALSIRVLRGHGYFLRGLMDERDMVIEDHGIVGRRVVTTAGVNFIVDAFQNTTEIETFKYHGLGTGSTAEAIGDTALVTELTTEYTGNVRATGTTVEGASANIYRTVATNTLDGTPGAALREHGIFSAASVGTLLDRTMFAAITLSSGDSLETTYEITLAAGS